MTANIEAQDKFLTVNNLRLHYLDWGGQEAQPMVLLHGMTGTCHSWDFFASAMRRDYHVLALDQRGHGDSQWADSYAADDFLADLDAFLDALGLDRVILIGHSMGGRNAIMYAARYRAKVTHLVSVDIGPEIGQAGLERIRQTRAAEPPVFGNLEAARRYIRLGEPRYSEAVLEHQLRHSLRERPDGKLEFKCDGQFLTMSVSRPPVEELWSYVRQLTCPTLIVRGALSDILLHDVALGMQQKVPNSRLVEIEGAGHSVPCDNPEAFEAAVRHFLHS